MILELEEPFKSLWKNGYIVINPENRRNVCLVNNNIDRTTISYARYLMCVKIGYILSSEFEVDHVDDDKTNDIITNLQILTKEQNRLKQDYNYAMNKQIVYGVQCAYCSLLFMLTERDVKNRLHAGTEYAFCSKSCASHFNFKGISGAKNTTDVERIKALKQQGLSSYKISEITGYARNTVMKHW